MFTLTLTIHLLKILTYSLTHSLTPLPSLPPSLPHPLTHSLTRALTLLLFLPLLFLSYSPLHSLSFFPSFSHKWWAQVVLLEVYSACTNASCQRHVETEASNRVIVTPLEGHVICTHWCQHGQHRPASSRVLQGCLIARSRVWNVRLHTGRPYLSVPVYGALVSGSLQSREPFATCSTRERLRNSTRGIHDSWRTSMWAKKSVCEHLHHPRVLTHAFYPRVRGWAAGLPAQWGRGPDALMREYISSKRIWLHDRCTSLFFVWRLQQRKATSGSVLQQAKAMSKPSSTDINSGVVLFEPAKDIAPKLFSLDGLWGHDVTPRYIYVHVNFDF